MRGFIGNWPIPKPDLLSKTLKKKTVKINNNKLGDASTDNNEEIINTKFLIFHLIFPAFQIPCTFQRVFDD